MAVIFHIFVYKVRGWSKFSSNWGAEQFFKGFATFVVFGGFGIGAYFFSREITFYIMNTVHLGAFLLHRFISMALYVFFLSVNVGNVIVAYASLYRSKETAYYLTKPVSHTGVFVVKFFDSFFHSSGTLFFIAFAVLAGYGSYFHLDWVFYVRTVFLLFIPFMLLSGAIGVILLLLLMKLVEHVGIRTLVGTIAVGYLSAIFFYFKFTNPMAMVRGVMKYYPYVDLYFGFLDPPLSRYVPSHWFAESLYWTVRGNPTLAAANMFKLLAVCAWALIIMVLVGKLLYYRTWLVSMDVRAKSEAKSANIKQFSFASKPWIEIQSSVLAKKELWQFFREPSQWIHLSIIALLIFVFVSSISELNIVGKEPFLQTISYLVVYVFNAFLISSIALRFVYPMMSTEGMSFWTIRSAPIRMRKVYWLKFMFAAIPVVVVSELLAVASQRPFWEFPAVIPVAMVSVFFVAIAINALNLSLGSFFSDFRESNPIQIASSQGATLTFLLTIVYLIFLVAALFYPINLYFEAVIKRTAVNADILFGSAFVVAAVSLLTLFITSLLGIRSLKRDM